MTGTGRIADLKALDDLLESESMQGLWVGEDRHIVEPRPFGAPRLWKWSKIREGLDAAARLVPTNFKGSRRAITLVHPDIGRGTSNTLVMAVQLVKAGEAVYANRHTAAAIRFILEGGEDTYTITDGEKCVMEIGDLVVQPNWSWHNHVNESERDAVWIDALDVGLMAHLRTMFQEPHPAEDVRLFNSATDTTVRNPGSLSPPGRSPKGFVYKWRETLPALNEMLEADKSPHDGRCLEYRDPATGGPTFPTFSCWIQMLDPGERTSPHRHTANHLYHGFRGSGVIEVEGTEVAWEQGDFVVVPNWSWHRHRNSSDEEPAILFSATDRPLLELLGLYREEARNGKSAR